MEPADRQFGILDENDTWNGVIGQIVEKVRGAMGSSCAVSPAESVRLMLVKTKGRKGCTVFAERFSATRIVSK